MVPNSSIMSNPDFTGWPSPPQLVNGGTLVQGPSSSESSPELADDAWALVGQAAAEVLQQARVTSHQLSPPYSVVQRRSVATDFPWPGDQLLPSQAEGGLQSLNQPNVFHEEGVNQGPQAADPNGCLAQITAAVEQKFKTSTNFVTHPWQHSKPR